jgi:raffinose/stachyose/melibiose transport system permease protein
MSNLWVGIKYLALLVASFAIVYPPYIVFVNAFKTNEEFAQSSSMALPHSFLNFDNFVNVFVSAKMGLAFYNTSFIIFITLLGNVLLSTMAAYAIGRFHFRGKKTILFAYILATIIPAITTQVATFSLVKGLGLVNTLFAPTLLYIGTDVVQIYIYLQFITNIPYDLDESAMIEGASLVKIYRKIIFPLLAPATATVIILKTIGVYNDMYTPFLYMPKSSLVTVSTSLMRNVGVNSANWTFMCAGILIILIPTMIMYVFLQRYIFAGVTNGAVK